MFVMVSGYEEGEEDEVSITEWFIVVAGKSSRTLINRTRLKRGKAGPEQSQMSGNP